MTTAQAELTRSTLQGFARRHGSQRKAVAILQTWPGLEKLNYSTWYRWIKQPSPLAYYVAFAIRLKHRLERDGRRPATGELVQS